VSERAYLSIGEVLQLLQDEFPDVTISKIRFLESQGLIDPERTPSGYRKFYDADIERLKFILREQKDSYLPLKVIKHRLDAGEGTGPVIRPFVMAVDVVDDDARDADPPGEEPHGPGTGAAEAPTVLSAVGPVADGPEGVEVAPTEPEEDAALVPPSSLTFDELVGASGLTAAQLREVERYGLVVGRPVGRTTYYDEEALVISRLVGGFLRFGIEPRHVRMYRNAAEREAGVFEQVILPLVKQRNPQARVQALASLAELTQLGSGLRDAMMRQALRGYTDSL
jgi:DNA-binding transcriptional MerR regulator